MMDRKRLAGIFLAALSVALSAYGYSTSLTNPSPAVFPAGGYDIPLLSERTVLDERSIVNAGDVNDLCRLPGIGEGIAGSIIQEREENGLYRYPEDLLSVRGIGAKKLSQFRELLETCLDREE